MSSIILEPNTVVTDGEDNIGHTPARGLTVPGQACVRRRGLKGVCETDLVSLRIYNGQEDQTYQHGDRNSRESMFQISHCADEDQGAMMVKQHCMSDFS